MKKQRALVRRTAEAMAPHQKYKLIEIYRFDLRRATVSVTGTRGEVEGFQSKERGGDVVGIAIGIAISRSMDAVKERGLFVHGTYRLGAPCIWGPVVSRWVERIPILKPLW
jgi:hypothetical protein